MPNLLNPQLKQKVQSINDYSNEPLVTEETMELAGIIDDIEAPMDERILAAKVMVNVCENRKKRATNQVTYFTVKLSNLVHSSETEKAKASLVKEGQEKLASLGDDETIALLKSLLDKVSSK